MLRRNVGDTLERHVGVHAVWCLHDHFTRTRASRGSRPTIMMTSNRELSRSEGRRICTDACLVAIHGVLLLLLLMVVVMVLLVRRLMKRLQVVRVRLVHLRRDRVRLRGEVVTLVHRGGVAHASLFALTQRFRKAGKEKRENDAKHKMSRRYLGKASVDFLNMLRYI